MPTRRELLRSERQPAKAKPAIEPHPLEAAALIVEDFARGKDAATSALLARIALCIRHQPRSAGEGGNAG